MKDLIKALYRGAVDKHRCLGCEFEDGCSIHGCQVMKKAAEKLEELGGAVLTLASLADDVADYADDLCSSANDYINLLNVSELNTGGDGCDKAKNEHLVFCTDFQRCVGEASLKEILVGIDRLGYSLAAVSQDGDAYTLFFRRPRSG